MDYGEEDGIKNSIIVQEDMRQSSKGEVDEGIQSMKFVFPWLRCLPARKFQVTRSALSQNGLVGLGLVTCSYHPFNFR